MSAHAIQHDELDLRIRWPEGDSSRFPWIWLRYNEPGAFDPVTRERQLDLARLAPDMRPEHVGLEDDSLVVRWADCKDESVVPLAWLADRRPGGHGAPDPAALAPELWDASLAGRLPRHRADGDLLAALLDLKRFGLALVEGLGDDPEAGVAYARRIAFIRETYFGAIFEVRTEPKPNSLAYTAQPLTPHTDLPYLETPPGFQFLHCIRNAATGGASLFVDGFRAAARLREEAPEDHELLCRQPMPFRFVDDAADMRFRRPILGRGADGEVAAIAFSAALADELRLEADPAQTRRFYAAYRRFMAILRRPELMLKMQLEPGSMAVFDNHRVLHGRDAFDPSTGERWLRGFYIDHTDLDSRIRALARAPLE